MKSRRIFLLVLSLLICAGIATGQTPAAPESIPVVHEALKPSPLETNLQKLTDEIGGRVPGSPAMQRAVEWGIAAFKAAGADTVVSESFDIPMGWSEGPTRLSVTAPAAFNIRAVSVAWSPAVAQPLRAKFVDVGDGTAEEFAKAGSVAGSIVLVHSKVLAVTEDLFEEYLRAPAIINRAMKGKAAAIAWTASREHDILYRHANSFDGRVDRIPQLVVAREDAERVSRLLTKGPVQGELLLPNRIGGPIKSANVVAEIKGTELPNEQVIIGAHLDSWELGTGALDNGCNAALVVDTLRAIKASGTKPRRTLKFVLFSGEEQGMLGSRAYTRRHRNELDNVVAVVVFDMGTGKTTGFSLGGRKDIATKVNEIMEPFAAWGANTQTTDAFWGTDNFDFLLEGVPTLVANQDAANYLVNYHATSDTYDKVDLPQLRKHVAISAHLLTAIANAPERLGARQSRNEIEQLLHDTQLDQQLQTFGLWEGWMNGTLGRAK